MASATSSRTSASTATASLRDALDALGAPGAGVAVALDSEVVPRAAWARTPLAEGARIEVLTAVQGG